MQIALLGAGNMGAALVRGFLINEICTPDQITLIDCDRSKLDTLHSELGCRTADSCEDLSTESPPTHFLIAVKPQGFQAIAGDIGKVIGESTVVVSIMAGVSLSFLQQNLPQTKKLVRAMPNLPASIGEGMTVLFSSEACHREEQEQVVSLFQAVGGCFAVEDEALINSATAVSGSGPGFVFHLLSAGIDAAEEVGFSREEAAELIYRTAAGALVLWNQAGDTPEEWEKRVTSPNGTTEAGISVMLEAGIRDGIVQTIKRARERANELSEG